PGVRYVKNEGKVMKEQPIEGKDRDRAWQTLRPYSVSHQVCQARSRSLRTMAVSYSRVCSPTAISTDWMTRMRPYSVSHQVCKDRDRAWQTWWETEYGRIRVIQSVEIAVGEQTRLYDTAIVRYQIWNRDKTPHTVGLRIMLDSYIGATDG